MLPGKPLSLFLNLFLRGLKLNAFMASLGTRWGFRHLKPVLRPYSLRGMWYSFPKPVLHVSNVERDTEHRSDGSLNSRVYTDVAVSVVVGVHFITIYPIRRAGCYGYCCYCCIVEHVHILSVYITTNS